MSNPAIGVILSGSVEHKAVSDTGKAAKHGTWGIGDDFSPSDG
jgi:hypothetical protein